MEESKGLPKYQDMIIVWEILLEFISSIWNSKLFKNQITLS